MFNWKKSFIWFLVFAFLGSLFCFSDAFAKRSGFSSGRSSSSFRSSSSYKSKSSSYKSKSSSFWKSKGTKNKNIKVAKTTKSRKGFGGTSIFDKSQAKKIKTAKVNKAKKAYQKDTSKFKKKPVPAYTRKTIPKNIKSNPIFSKTRVKSTNNYSTYRRQRNAYYRQTGWHTPTYVYDSSPSFGMWDSMMLWMMLDNMNDNNYARMAYNHSDDPGFQEWKKEAERMAADNVDLKNKLAQMDAKLDTMTGEKDASYLPEGVPATIVLSAEVLAVANKDLTSFTLATDITSGNYYRTGTILKNSIKNVIAVNVKSTKGTMENIKLFIDGKVDGMIGQADGIDVYALSNPALVNKMKAKWIPLYSEVIQMVSNVDGGVKSIKDLDKKNTLFIGPKGSGTSLTWKRIVKSNPKRYKNIKTKNATYADALDMVERFPSAVMLYVSGLNSKFMKSVESIAIAKGLRLVEINDNKLDDVIDIDGNSLYSFVEIPSKVYPNLQKGWVFGNDVKSIAVQAVFIINDAWLSKNGPEALDDLTAGVIKAQAIISNSVNGDLE